MGALSGNDLPDPLVVMALEQEAGDVFQRAGVPVLYTGVGKVNAAYHLALRLAAYSHAGAPVPFVVNFGTAGSPQFPARSVVACRSFVQRDMDASALGFEVGQTPFDPVPLVLTFPALDLGLPEGVCGSGDSFATTCIATSCSVFDMEAYALAKVCWLQGAKFASIKYITDGADHEAADTWKANLQAAPERFLEVYHHIRSAIAATSKA
jgi:adenosylhomocysteine nucleosidase